MPPRVGMPKCLGVVGADIEHPRPFKLCLKPICSLVSPVSSKLSGAEAVIG